MLKKISSLALLINLSACLANYYNVGNNIADPDKKHIKINSSKEELVSHLGTPSIITHLDGESWYYISHRLKQKSFLSPSIEKQETLKLEFKNDKIASITHFNTANLQKIKFSQDATPALGSDDSVLREVWENLRRYNIIPKIK